MPLEDFIFNNDPSSSQLSLVHEINHRVINEFTEAIASLALATRHASPEARDAIGSAAKRLRAHVNLHRALLPPANNELIELGTYVGRLCACFAETSLADRGMQLTIRAEDVWIEASRAWRVGLIVAELVRNAIQHGHSGEGKHIDVNVEQCCDQVLCAVRNDGASTEPELNHQRGRGCRLTRALAADLGGSIEWEFNSPNCRASLIFPVLVTSGFGVIDPSPSVLPR